MTLPMELPSLSHLPGAVRDALTDWLADCDLNWQEGQIAVRRRQLPAECLPFRELALVELVKIDLVQMWRRGHEVLVESYLERFPEFGTSDSVAPDLIVAEIDARQRSARPATDNEIAERFPQQIEAVRLLVSGTSLLKESETLPRTVLEAQKRTASVSPVDTDMPTAKDAHGTIAVGAKFGLNERYQILKKLGGGGMGSVYLATDRELGDRKVAIKVPRFAPTDGPEMLDRFKREAALLAALSHPNLGIVFDVNQFEGTSYLVMEFIDGQSLGEYAKSHLLTPPQAVSIVRQVASALRTAHAAGVVHRDMKPENIMLTKSRQPKVIDFGLAVDVNRSGPRATQTGTTMGTPEYMPIEQLRGDLELIGPRSDVYSLGVVLFKLLTGMVPFSGDNAVQVFEKLANDDVPSPQLFCPELDPALTDIVLKAIAKQSADRYETMADFEKALAAHSNKSPDTSNFDSRVSEMIPGQLGGQSLSSLANIFVESGERGGVSPPVSLAIALPELTGGLTPPRSPISRVFQSRPRIAVAFVATILLGAILWFRTGNAVVKVEVLADDVEVTFVNESIKVTDGKNEYRVKPGVHRLHVKSGDVEFDTDNFTLKRGGNPVVRIELKNERLESKFGQVTIGSTPISTKPSPTDSVTNTAKPETRTDDQQPHVVDGTWVMEGDELVNEGINQNQWLIFGSPDWTDYDITFETCCNKAGLSYGIVFRYMAKDHFWYMQFGPWAHRNLDLVAVVPGEDGWRHPSRRFMPDKVHGKLNVWQSVKMKLRGDEVTAIVDGETVAVTQRDRLPKGRVGFYTFCPGLARWRNLEVRDPNGKLLWKGFPNLKKTAPIESKADAALPQPSVAKTEKLAPPPAQPSERVQAVLGEGHGKWQIKEGELWCAEHSNDTEDWLLVGNPEWTDYDFTVRATTPHPLTGHGPGVFFRSLPQRRATLVALNVFKSTQDYFDEIDGPSWRSPWNDDAMPRHVSPTVRDWSGNGHEIKVRVRGASAKVFVDGTETLAYDKLKHAKGYVGVRSHKDWPSRFRNPKVTAPDGKVLLDGWPTLPPGIGVIEAETTKRFATWAVSHGGQVIVPGGKSIDSITDGMILHIVSFDMDPAVVKPLEDGDLDHFQNLPGVENSLGFRFQKITPAGLIKLGALMQDKPISRLGLVDMPIGLSSFRQPGGFAAITGGTFQNVAAKDDELVHLRNLRSLDQLNLRFNKAITDAGLVHLAELKTLKHLALDGTSVTAAGVAKLQAALPGCEITTSLPAELNREKLLWKGFPNLKKTAPIESKADLALPQPSAALQALRREQIPVEALTLAGNGDPQKAPANLVGVLGEVRPIHRQWISSLVFSPDNRWLASGCFDTTIMLRDPMTTEVKRVLRSHTDRVNSVAFSKDSQTLISGSEDGTLKIWSVEKDEPPETLAPNIGQIYSVAVSQDGRFVAAGGRSGVIKLWKWGEWQKSIELPAIKGIVRVVTFAPDGETLASGGGEDGDEARVRLHRTSDGELVRDWVADKLHVTNLAYHPDGKWLGTTGGGGGAVKLWEAASGKVVAEAVNWTTWPAMAFHPNGKSMYACLHHNIGHLLELPTMKAINGAERPIHAGAWGIVAAAFRPDGKAFVVGTDTGGVHLWEAENWQRQLPTNSHSHYITTLAVHPNGRTVLTGGDDFVVRKWDVTRPTQSQLVQRIDRKLLDLAYSPDGSKYVSTSAFEWHDREQRGFVWDAESGQQLFKLKPPPAIDDVVFSPDGKVMAAGDHSTHCVHLWDAKDGSPLHQFPKAGPCWAQISFTRDGQRLAMATADTGLVKVLDVVSRDEVYSFKDEPSGAVALSADGRYLASGHLSGSLSLWDLSAKEPKPRTLLGHTAPVTTMRFTPDNKTLITSSEDGTLRLWNIESPRVPQQTIMLGSKKQRVIFALDPSSQYVFVSGDSHVIFVLRRSE